MNLFCDTSALVKLFHEEEGSPFITDLLCSPDNEIWILDLACIEIYSALYRRFRNHELTHKNLNEAIAGFKDQIWEFNIEPMGSGIVHESLTLIQKYGKTHGLRTLDALHLSAFSLIADDGWMFVCADATLCEVARLDGWKVRNPLDP